MPEQDLAAIACVDRLRALSVQVVALHDVIATELRIIASSGDGFLPDTETVVARRLGHTARRPVTYADATAFLVNMQTNADAFASQQAVTQKMLPTE